MKTIVEAKGIYKQYRSGDRIEYLSLRESISDFFKGTKTEKSNLFYALEDVNFEIKEGESVGILGKNGAGKSTLLKVMSKITFPTKGEITMRARVASLLEVGTGFHSEMTGRENVYFNGTILGLKKYEIDRLFDSIVDFSGVEKFLDTPLKRYSSGMAVRLGFAVAAHLEPELMIVDEVLAVGDAEFQKKCINKMHDVVRDGRTVIFVSHSMQMLDKLCNRGIYLDEGKIISDGKMHKVINQYLDEHAGVKTDNYFSDTRTGDFAFVKVELFDLNGKTVKNIRSGHGMKLRIHYRSTDPKLTQFGFDVVLSDNKLRDLIYFTSNSLKDFTIPMTSECYFEVEVGQLPLLAGHYFLSFHARDKNRRLDFTERSYPLEIVFDDFYGTGMLPADGVLLNYKINV